MWKGMDPPTGDRKMFADRDTRFIRIVRDVDFGGVTRLGAGAVRLVTRYDLVGAALFVPCNVTDPAAGVIALDPGDYEALEAPVPFDVAIQAF